MSRSPDFDARMSNRSVSAGLRYGFYLHLDTLWPQKVVDQWPEQNTKAVGEMVAAHGAVIDTYFDDITTEDPTGQTPWGQRPQAKRLLADLAADRLDAAVVGTVRRRAFAATPVWDVVMLLTCQGKQLWTADIGSALDPRNLEHVLWLKINFSVSEPNPALLNHHG